MRALVTGSQGFVGAWLVRELETAAHTVVAIDRDDADVRDAASIARIVGDARPDAVFHLAAQASVAQSYGDPVGTYETNVLGTVALLEALRTAASAARVVVASSAEVYGVEPDESNPLAEDHPLRPVSPYAASKVAQEAAALQYWRSFGVDVVIARSFNAIGPGQRTTFALSAFAHQLVAIGRGRSEPVLRVGNLEAVRDFTDVRDVVRAYVAMAERAAAGGVYNIASGTGRSIADALAVLVAASGLEVEIAVDESRLRPSDVPWLVGDSARLRRETGWSPTISIQESARDLLAFHRSEE